MWSYPQPVLGVPLRTPDTRFPYKIVVTMPCSARLVAAAEAAAATLFTPVGTERLALVCLTW